MRTHLLVCLPVLVVACTFPDVDTTGLDTASTTSTSTSPDTTTTTGDPSTTTGSTSSTGDGGAPPTTTSSTGDGGAGAGGSTTSQGGAGGAGGIDPGGDGTCPVGSDGEGCDYLDAAGTPTDGDCDQDGVPNAEDDCQPCDAAVPWDQPPDVFTADFYLTLDLEESWDWNCDGTESVDLDYLSGGCVSDTGACDASSYYVSEPRCGENATVQDCETEGFVLQTCESTGTRNQVAACR